MPSSLAPALNTHHGTILSSVSALYLLIPAFLFAAGWLRPLYAVVTLLALGALAGFLAVRLFVALRAQEAIGRRPHPEGHASYLAGVTLAALILLAWLLFSGSGGCGFQNSDYIAANALLKDLILRDWPITLTYGNATRPVVYYLAYYLPAAAVGKAWGWAAANRFLFLWTAVGVVIAFAWFVRFTIASLRVRWHNLVGVACIFCLAGGLDLIGYYLIRQKWPFDVTTHVQWWASFFQYSSMTTLLYWVPQHAIAAWLVTCMVIDAMLERSDLRTLGIALTCSILWSPFGLLGTMPYLLALALLVLMSDRRRELLRGGLPLIAALCLWVSNILALYVTASAFVFPHGFVWQFLDEGPALFLSLGAFWLLEFGLLGGLILVLLARTAMTTGREGVDAGSQWARWQATLEGEFNMPLPLLLLLLLSLAMLTILPLYRIGRWDNITLRVSIPALFVIWLCVARMLVHATALVRSQQRLLFGAMIAVVCLGFLTSVPEIARSITRYSWQPPAIATVASVTNLDTADWPETKHERVGDPDAPFFRYFGK